MKHSLTFKDTYGILEEKDISGMIKSPMLAHHINTDEGVYRLKYPQLCTPKLDGVRTLLLEGKALSRTYKPVPNIHIRNMLETISYNLDGEIIVPGLTFKDISGVWRREEGEPLFEYWVFDYIDDRSLTSDNIIQESYESRIDKLSALLLPVYVNLLIPELVQNAEELLSLEIKYLAQGHEGLMCRLPSSPYKCGRSTPKEQYLTALKRFVDSEAVVIGIIEQFHNNNEPSLDSFGHKKRSSHKENKSGKNTLGALVCRGVIGKYTDVIFNIGTGFDDTMRDLFWHSPPIDEIVNFSYQECGSDTKPRIPVFRGIRPKEDLN